MKQARAADYRWFAAGDVNGFFGLMFDNLTVLSFLFGILVGLFGFPAEVVATRMFPGTALGVMFGDLVYTWMAIRLARRSGNPNVTAMPLGLDTPSTIGVALTVLGPAFLMYKQRGMNPQDAAMATWYLGMAVMIYIGIIKVVFSFIGGWVQRIVPQAGLLGSLAGIGLALIGFLPLIDIFQIPVVGALSLGLILYTLVAGIRLPRNVPGVAVAVLLSTVLYYVLPKAWMGGGAVNFPTPDLRLFLPVPTLGFIHGLTDALDFLPIAIPFGILTVVGGINVTESARVAGDDFNTRDVLMTEAVATLVAGVCGGVAQSTPYIGQPAYKSMGSRAGYTLLTGIFVGLGGMLGYVSFIVEAIPRAVLAPILIFVALDIMVQATAACPLRHAPAVYFAYIPTVARMLWIKLAGFANDALDVFKANPPLHDKITAYLPHGQLMLKFFEAPQAAARELAAIPVINALGNGFIVTAMLWGAFMAHLIDRKLKLASLYLAILAGMTFCGIVHSVHPDGNMYWPWQLPPHLSNIVYQFTAAYLILGAVIFLLSFTRESHEPPQDDLHTVAPGISEHS